MSDFIKTLDFQDWEKGGEDKTKFVQELKSSFTDTGFFLLKNHTISSDLLMKNRKLFEIFFKELSLQERMQYVFPKEGYQMGYTPMKTERATVESRPDEKHFCQTGDISKMPFIKEIPELQGVSEELFQQFHSLYKELMRAVALSLELNENNFDNELGNSIARHIHYPASDNPATESHSVKDDSIAPTQGGNVMGMCAEQHTDINDLTLLHATEPGLELLHNGVWTPVVVDPSTIIVNVGDMLWHLTGGRYKSGVHRVVCEPGVERFSSPFFGHRYDKSSIRPLKHLGKSDLWKFHFKNEGQFLRDRLEQIGLFKKPFYKKWVTEPVRGFFTKIFSN